jgi:cytochrome P450
MIDYHPCSDAIFDDPFPIYRQMRDEAPLLYLEEFDCFFLSRFEDIWNVIDDPRLTATRGTTTIDLLLDRPRPGGLAMSAMDKPMHTALRKTVSRDFMPRAARALEGRARELARSYVEEGLERGEFDVVADYAMRLSVRIACTILGIPLADADALLDGVNRFFDREEGVQGPSEVASAATEELRGYFRAWVAERRKSDIDRDDLLGRLLAFEFEGEKLEDETVVTNLQLMVVGGTETLPKVAAGAVYQLGKHPDQRAELAADPGLIPDAFWEALRYDMPTSMLGRAATEPLVLHGQTIEAGQKLMFLWPSANRDEREFDEPERFDIHRRAPRILSFGHSTHRCLGHNMARMEGRILIEELLARVPDYEVIEDGVVRLRSEFFRGLGALPIRVGPR